MLGPNLGAGYDIGCKFSTTISKTSLGPIAREKNFTSLVGGFHGHAHKRLCQMFFLSSYIKGLGLSDLENCERYFSKSNALAVSVRYATVFHRQQEISTYMAHTDCFETYPNLSEPLFKVIKLSPDKLFDRLVPL